MWSQFDKTNPSRVLFCSYSGYILVAVISTYFQPQNDYDIEDDDDDDDDEEDDDDYEDDSDDAPPQRQPRK